MRQSAKLIRVVPFCFLFLLFSCSINIRSVQDIKPDDILSAKPEEKPEERAEEKPEEKPEEIFEEKPKEVITEEAVNVISARLANALSGSKLPQNNLEKIKENVLQSSDFINELQAILLTDSYLWVLVDKEHPLGARYEPDDLVQLKNGSYALNNNEDLMLRGMAADSLEEMAFAAGREGITLIVSYAYRSYTRQNQSYSMHVRNMGQREADRISARPGYSQHQLGLTIDFGSVNNTFAGTPQGLWLLKNASRFGWSLSYPSGYEAVTGYSWESWHYRYVGVELADFINKYFNGIQQYALRFIHEYVNFKQTVDF